MAHLLLIDDEEKLLEVLKEALETAGHEVESASDPVEGLRRAETGAFDVVVTDLRMPQLTGLDVLKLLRERSPDTEVILITAYATIETAVEATKVGAFGFLEKPVRLEQLRALVARALDKQRLARENRQLKHEVLRRFRSEAVVAESGVMQEVLSLAHRAAESSATVLIRGESGTGKEVIARVIHNHGPRGAGPFVKISCAAIPEGLLESELFGHEKGAFTGAVRSRPGRFEQANSGTIFLDEIGELPLALQAKLLRVLQEREFERVGGDRTLRVDVRVIAATNRDLEEAVAGRQFREDLYWRLNVVPIRVPPLREHPEDIPALVAAFLARPGGRLRSVSAAAMKVLVSCPWPGNVRELENAVERAGVMARGSELLIEDLSETLRAGSAASAPAATAAAQRTRRATASVEIPDDGLSLEEVERTLLVKALSKSEGNRTKAAKLLGISRRQLGYRLQKFRLEDDANGEGGKR